MIKLIFKYHILAIATLLFIFSGRVFSQKCVVYNLNPPTNSTPCTGRDTFFIRITPEQTFLPILNWSKGSGQLSISNCNIFLKFNFDGSRPGMPPEDISVGGDLTETSRGVVELQKNQVSFRADCNKDSTGKQWRFFNLGSNFNKIPFRKYNDATKPDTGSYIIVSTIHTLTIGRGASVIDSTKLGGYGKYRLSDNSTLEMSFLLEEAGKPICDKCEDTTPPVFTNCPTNITQTAVAGTNCTYVNWKEPTATDNSGIEPKITFTHRNGYCFLVGATTVTYTAKDTSGNTSKCSFIVTINPPKDTKPPVISNCPTSVTQISSSATACVSVSWKEPTATDESGTPTLSSNYKSGYCFPVGATTVIYSAKDLAGNTSNCSFVVTIKPKSAVECTQYVIENTHQRCAPQTFKPYALTINNVLYKSDYVTFGKKSDGTATISGVFREVDWKPVFVNIALKNFVTVLPASQIVVGNCISRSVNTKDWYYYKTWSGTIQKLGQIPFNIAGTSPMQIGTGANTQDVDILGAAGNFAFTSTNQTGTFNLQLVNPTNCPTSFGFINASVFTAQGRSVVDKIQLNWYENTAQLGEYFKIEKLNSFGDFELLDLIPSKTGNTLRDYILLDKSPVKGENIYRITLIKNDGYEKQTDNIKVLFDRNSVKIFPNPSEGEFDIQLNTDVSAETIIRVYNAIGQLQFEVKSINENIVHIDLSDFTTGLYTVRISQNNKRDVTEKLILEK